MKRSLPIIALAVALSLASCMSHISVPVMKPAQVTVPQNIQTVAVINRTLPKTQLGNILEGVLTGETIGQDKQGTEKAIEGISKTLMESPRYEVKRTSVEMVGSGTGGTFPAPLVWSQVEKVCRDYGTDAVLAIETYDSDYIITNGSKQEQEKVEGGGTTTKTVYTAEGVASVKMGFRLYDPVNKTIVDQDQFSQDRRWSAQGSTATAAARELVQRRYAVNQVSYWAGANYAKRIAPVYTNVNRGYFKKSKKDLQFEKGVRQADVGDWNTAAESWERCIQTSDYKTKGKAAYNIALANEVNGNLEGAKEWSQRSYADFGCKKARDYTRTIDQRLWEAERLKEQMGNKEVDGGADQ